MTLELIPYTELIEYSNESNIQRWINHGILLPVSIKPAPGRPAMVPEDNAKRLALIKELDLHSEDEIHWEFFKTGRKDQISPVKVILIKAFFIPGTAHHTSEKVTPEMITELNVDAITSRLAMNRNHLASLRKRIDEKANTTLSRALPYLIWPFIFGRRHSDELSIQALAFKDVFGETIFAWHTNFARKELVNLDVWKKNLQEADDFSMAIIAAIFSHGEKYPNWIKPFLSISFNKNKVKWVIRAYMAGLLATAIRDIVEAGRTNEMLANLQNVGCTIRFYHEH